MNITYTKNVYNFWKCKDPSFSILLGLFKETHGNCIFVKYQPTNTLKSTYHILSSFDLDMHPVHMREPLFFPYQRHAVWPLQSAGYQTTVTHQQCTFLDICNHMPLPKRP